MTTTKHPNQASDQPVNVRPVRGGRDLKAFIQTPNHLYLDDPHAVIRLYAERKLHFTRNAFFKHATWQAWVAWRGKQPVGRISAQIDHLHLECSKEKTGFFGSLEAEEDPAVFHALFSAAEDWLKENGMQRVIGPMNLNINQEVGLLVDGFDTPPCFMMGHAPTYYQPQVEQCGYTKEIDLLAYTLKPDSPYPKTMRDSFRRYAKRFKTRPLNIKKKEEDLLLMRSIFNEAWAGNWGFVPFTEEEFFDIGNQMLAIVDANWLQITEFDGEPAAFTVTLPNINEAIHGLKGKLLPFGWLKLLWRLKVRHPKSARIALLGVLTKYQNSLAGAAIVFHMLTSVEGILNKHQVKKLELSWILENNERMRKVIELSGDRPYKTYRVYTKALRQDAH